MSTSTETVKAACPHDCPDTCAMEVTVEQRGGRRVAVKVAGSAAHAPTQGVLCTKVSRYLERTYHPKRVLRPLKRVGRKGEGRFVPVSWDEALTDIAQRLQAIAAVDPQRIVPYSYAGTMGLVQGESMAQRFFHKLGASLLDRTICATAGAEALTFSGIGLYRREFLDGWRGIVGDAPGANETPPRFKLRPLFDAAIARGTITGQRHDGRWTDVGTPERLAALDAALR